MDGEIEMEENMEESERSSNCRCKESINGEEWWEKKEDMI
jgi:hypothetical protein